jgi:acyl-CoA thioester hydrolase
MGVRLWSDRFSGLAITTIGERALKDEAPLALWDLTVEPEWVDYNGHMNDAAYALVFSRAGDRWMDRIGLGKDVREATGYTLYTLQVMLHYFHEAKVGVSLRVVCQLLEFDAKRARLWMEMRLSPQGPAIAASEQLYLSVRQAEESRAAPWREETRTHLERMMQAHAGLAAPAQAGRGISLKRT